MASCWVPAGVAKRHPADILGHQRLQGAANTSTHSSTQACSTAGSKHTLPAFTECMHGARCQNRCRPAQELTQPLKSCCTARSTPAMPAWRSGSSCHMRRPARMLCWPPPNRCVQHPHAQHQPYRLLEGSCSTALLQLPSTALQLSCRPPWWWGT